MAVIEAMAAGKPVVATRVGGVPDLVEDGDSGYTVELGDVAGLAQHVIELLSSVALRTRLGQRARQLAGRFQLEAVAAQYRQLYYQVAGRPFPADHGRRSTEP
jgi:glycosyltransferase involved in cell wall biosynthesis